MNTLTLKTLVHLHLTNGAVGSLEDLVICDIDHLNTRQIIQLVGRIFFP